MSRIGGTPLETLKFEEVTVGQELPPLVVEITPSLIIAGALFTRDPQDVHHDRDIAQRRGFKDIFMNTMTTTGLVSRYLSDWAGPEAVTERFTFRLGRPNYPYDEMRLTGRVTGAEDAGGRGRVTVDVRGANSLGDHVTCTVQLSLPRR